MGRGYCELLLLHSPDIHLISMIVHINCNTVLYYQHSVELIRTKSNTGDNEVAEKLTTHFDLFTFWQRKACIWHHTTPTLVSLITRGCSHSRVSLWLLSLIIIRLNVKFNRIKTPSLVYSFIQYKCLLFR